MKNLMRKIERYFLSRYILTITHENEVIIRATADQLNQGRLTWGSNIPMQVTWERSRMNQSLYRKMSLFLLAGLSMAYLSGCVTTPAQALIAASAIGVTAGTVATVNAQNEQTKQLETIMESRKW